MQRHILHNLLLVHITLQRNVSQTSAKRQDDQWEVGIKERRLRKKVEVILSLG